MTRREPNSSLPTQPGDTEGTAQARARADARMASWRKRHNFPAQGWVLYRGPGRLTADPIVVILTGLIHPSVNAKTGDVLQVYILPESHPGQAVKSGADESVCGDCPRRPALGGDCYVNAGWGPSRIWTAWKRGAYTPAPQPKRLREILAGASIRLGAYGDPAAAPSSIWRPLVESAALCLGYTHLWHHLESSEWGFLMASCDGVHDERKAHARGWRTFRVVDPFEPAYVAAGVRECLAVSRGLSCAACRGCDGARAGEQASRGWWVRAHGQRTPGAVKRRAQPLAPVPHGSASCVTPDHKDRQAKSRGFCGSCLNRYYQAARDAGSIHPESALGRWLKSIPTEHARWLGEQAGDRGAAFMKAHEQVVNGTTELGRQSLAVVTKEAPEKPEVEEAALEALRQKARRIYGALEARAMLQRIDAEQLLTALYEGVVDNVDAEISDPISVAIQRALRTSIKALNEDLIQQAAEAVAHG